MFCIAIALLLLYAVSHFDQYSLLIFMRNVKFLN